MWKTIGWYLLIAIASAIYSGQYLSWTTKAKHQAFKKQYVNHVATKLQLNVGIISANCSQQVYQELSTTLAQLCQLVNESTTKLKDEIKILDHKLIMLNTSSRTIKSILRIFRYSNNFLSKYEKLRGEQLMHFYETR